jgi:triacylglycerol esterase/lipase EstA (alpha/beta hydrolase family)
MALLSLLALLALACTRPAESAPGIHAPGQAEAVVLLHGLGRTDRSMRPLEKHLANSGFRVSNLRYASTEKSSQQLVDDLRQEVAACCAQAPVLHFVGHSLGGILVRAYLAQDASPQVGSSSTHSKASRPSAGHSVLRRWSSAPTARACPIACRHPRSRSVSSPAAAA